MQYGLYLRIHLISEYFQWLLNFTIHIEFFARDSFDRTIFLVFI